MNTAAADRIAKRLQTRYLDTEAATLEEALKILEDARRVGKPVSVGLLGNMCEVLPETPAAAPTAC